MIYFFLTGTNIYKLLIVNIHVCFPDGNISVHNTTETSHGPHSPLPDTARMMVMDVEKVPDPWQAWHLHGYLNKTNSLLLKPRVFLFIL